MGRRWREKFAYVNVQCHCKLINHIESHVCDDVLHLIDVGSMKRARCRQALLRHPSLQTKALDVDGKSSTRFGVDGTDNLIHTRRESSFV